MVNGLPDCALTIPFTCHPPVIAFTARLDLVAGRSHTQLPTIRCGVLKSESPRSAARLRASCALCLLLSLLVELVAPESIDFDHEYDTMKLSPRENRRSNR